MNEHYAQTALKAAALVHQQVAAGAGAGGQTSRDGVTRVFHSPDEEVLKTASAFLEWLTARGA